MTTQQMSNNNNDINNVCGIGTEWHNESSSCFCTTAADGGPYADDEDDNVLFLAGIFDTTTFDWGPDICEYNKQIVFEYNMYGISRLSRFLRYTRNVILFVHHYYDSRGYRASCEQWLLEYLLKQHHQQQQH